MSAPHSPAQPPKALEDARSTISEKKNAVDASNHPQRSMLRNFALIGTVTLAMMLNVCPLLTVHFPRTLYLPLLDREYHRRLHLPPHYWCRARHLQYKAPVDHLRLLSQFCLSSSSPLCFTSPRSSMDVGMSAPLPRQARRSLRSQDHFHSRLRCHGHLRVGLWFCQRYLLFLLLKHCLIGCFR